MISSGYGKVSRREEERVMLYIGHFTYECPEEREDNRYIQPGGYFTCMVEAGSVEHAREKLRQYVEGLDGWFAAFGENKVRGVFLDSLIEVRNPPSSGMIMHYEYTSHLRGDWLAMALPGIPEDVAIAYTSPEEEDEGGGNLRGGVCLLRALSPF
jgi:hypothetical protein